MTRRLISPILASLAALLLIAPAKAGLLPVQVSVTPEGGYYRWTYAVLLESDSQVRPGDYFTIYDFGGYVAGTNVQPEGWEFESSALGTTPEWISPDDDASLPNLTFRYTGSTVTGGAGLGNFWVLSDYQDATEELFAAQTHRTVDGQPNSNTTPTFVPVPTAPPPGIPEPATLALAGIGLPVLILARRWKR